MIKDKLFYGILAVIALIIGGCVARQPAISSESNFNLLFKYGVGAKNILNIFEGTYTKDMIMNPSITVKLSLSAEELDRIYKKMAEIGFFNYPNRFSVSVPPGEGRVSQTPHESYYFKIKCNSKTKELLWDADDASIANKDEKAKKLMELIKLIIDIIESKEEYKKLPPPRGRYL